MEVNEIIKKRRKELGLTLKQVAEQLGVSESLISRYESKDVKNMGIDKLVPLAKILKCEPAYLMGWIDEKIEDKKLCDIELPNGNRFEFKENNGKIKMLMKESNKSEWQEFQFDEYEQREFEKVMGMNMLFFNGKEVAPEDKIELEKTLLTIFIKAYFNHKK